MLALQKYDRAFQLIIDERLVGMYIMVFCSENIKPAISKVDTANVGCGLMGTFGNKGGLGNLSTKNRFSGSESRQATGQRFLGPNFRQESRTGF